MFKNLISRITTVKKITPEDNQKRLLLSGAFPNAWVHCRMEIHQLDKAIAIKLFSTTDDSLVKEFIRPMNEVGDKIYLKDTVISYFIDLVDIPKR